MPKFSHEGWWERVKGSHGFVYGNNKGPDICEPTWRTTQISRVICEFFSRNLHDFSTTSLRVICKLIIQLMVMNDRWKQKNNSISDHYKHEKKNSQETGSGGECHMNSGSYPPVMPGGEQVLLWGEPITFNCFDHSSGVDVAVHVILRKE